MRALAVALLLSVPLSAGDEPPLEKAVELFKSPDAGQRTAGSQLAERELRKLLAPLLRAMEDDDPEVRRRARRSILSLVPGEVEKEMKPQGPAQVRAAIRQALFARLAAAPNARVQWKFAPWRPELEQRGLRLMEGLGIKGSTRWKAPFMPGVVVTRVRKDSPAARLGLRRGDLIVRIGGKAVTKIRDLPRALGDKPDWTRIKVMVLREGRYVRLFPKK
jgi:C-terminal processing protease CtpA/Prc